MFGLSFEKIVIAGVIAVIVLGPRRLPYYAQKLGELVRLLKAQVTVAREQAAQSLGAEDWQTLDPRRYDPRRIIREALDEPTPATRSESDTGPSTPSSPDSATSPEATDTDAEVKGSYIITGSSGHPRRQFVAHTGDGNAGDEERTAAGSGVE